MHAQKEKNIYDATCSSAIHPPKVHSTHNKGKIRRLWSNHISESNAAEIPPLRLCNPPDFPNRVAPCVAGFAIFVIIIQRFTPVGVLLCAIISRYDAKR